jgi:hypothetical protein
MNLPFFLAQTPTLTPTDMPAATAIASVTSTPTPTATPFHVVMEQAPFWNSALGIFLVILIAIGVGVVIGLVVQKGGANGLVGKLLTMFKDFTDMLAYWVVILAFVGIFLLSYFVLTNPTETAKYVFAAVLPLLGTWVGTVLAHYFQKETLAAATQSMSDLASKVAGADKLQSVPVKNVMIRPETIKTLPDSFIGQENKGIKLSDVIPHLQAEPKRDRLPLFKGNQKSGPAAGVIHLSTMNTFISKKANQAPNQPVDNLKLDDLINDTEFKFKTVCDNSFGVVDENATLARAKAVMENLGQKIRAAGADGDCYDVFVTATGDAKEPVLGWITNDIINENAKV